MDRILIRETKDESTTDERKRCDNLGWRSCGRCRLRWFQPESNVCCDAGERKDGEHETECRVNLAARGADERVRSSWYGLEDVGEM